jgi:Na+-transporting methylmalonyl-CoA/oxaloacetate decarboxylase gamma subunit
MDTSKAFEIDTVVSTSTGQSQKIIKESNPFAIFGMGVAGVFIFVIFYIWIMKWVAVIINKKKENK